MPKIKILPLHEAQKIAAGEVVERPANIVKELIENALDAAATTISVHIEDGGKKLIRVIDTGCGMDVQDAQLCFDKHATSKITHVDALEHINTFGFRGEALASIAAVSKITLITKERDTTEGTKVTVEQNTVIDTQPVSANTGTDIAVHDLFYNIPARKKFLKVRDTEWRHILHLVQAFCLDYPEIHFKLFSDGKQIINCPATQNIRARCAQVWDQHISSDMLTIEAHREDNTFSILGIITNHQQFRYDRNTIFFFVNKRWVKDFKLSNALLKGYQNVLPHGKYPTACISITVDPTLVDINIHPRKEEVKFMHPRLIEQLIQQTVKQALEIHISANLNPKVMNTADMAISTPSTSFFSSHPSRSFTPYNFDPSTSDFAYPSVPARQASSDKPLSATPGMAERMDGELSSVGMTNTKENTHAFAMPDTLLDTQDMRNEMELQKTLGMQEELGQALRQGSEQALRQGSEQALRQGSGQALRQGSGQASILEGDYPPSVRPERKRSEVEGYNKKIYQGTTIIGQYHKTYILIEQKDGLFLIDQHAAHERILYELFAKTFDNMPTINLLFPQIITLSPVDIQTVTPYLSLFKQNGIIIEPFGEDQLIVQSIPVHLKNVKCDELVQQVIGWVNEYQHVEQAAFFKVIHEKLHAQMACKAAVKAGDTLTQEQMQQILTDLNNTANRFSCPHGRPTGFLLSLHEIEKKFKRKL